MSQQKQIFAAIPLALALFAGPAQAQVELISRTHPTLISDTAGGRPTSMSADGRYVVFDSSAKNLLPGQQVSDPVSTGSQVFLRDRQTGVTTLVSRTPASPFTTGNRSSRGGIISADGRFIVFQSQASNLIAGQNDSINTEDVFLYDRVAGTTILVSHASGSPTHTASDHSVDPVISADGRYIVFSSWAMDLLPSFSNEGELDVFLFDRVSGTLSLVSHATATPNLQRGGSTPAISADGAWVAFLSKENLTGDPTAGDFNARYLFLYETATGTVSLVSRKSDEPARRQKVSDSRAELSADGRFIAFTSPALHLVPGQTEGEGSTTDDVFVFDRVTGTTALASRGHASAVTPGNEGSTGQELSADGRYLAFLSGATDLVVGQVDTPGIPDVFVHDLVLGTTILVSRADGNAQTAAGSPSFTFQISADGSHVAFVSQATDLVPGQVPGFLDVFLFDRATGTQRWISRPTGAAQTALRWAHTPVISADGSYVAYTSSNSDLVSGVHDPLQDYDAFLYSRATEESSLLSRRDPASPALSASGEAPLVSADGRFVAYRSTSSLLLPGPGNEITPGLYLYDRVSESTTLVSRDQIHGFSSLAPLGISADGRFLTFQSRSTDVIPGQVDSPLSLDVFSSDRIEGSIRLVSRTAASPVTTGMHHDARGSRPSRDGRYIPFVSPAEDLVPGQIEVVPSFNVFLHDRATGASEMVSHAAGAPAREANGSSEFPSISPDGRYVAFVSSATDLVPGVTDTNDTSDLFLHDRSTGATTLLSRSGAAANKTANGESWGPVFAGGGRCLVFISRASDLVAGSTDTNNRWDVFLYSLVTGKITLVSRAHGSLSTGGNGDSFSPSTGADCSAIAFKSFANNLVPGQAPDQTFDLFLAEPVLGSMRLLGTGFVDPFGFSTQVAVVSEDSRFVAFSTPDDLLGGGADFAYDNLYLFDRASRDVLLVSRAGGAPSTAANQHSGAPSFSDDSRFVAFHSTASDLVAGDFNGGEDVFLFDTQNAGSDFYTLSAPCRLVDTRQPEDGPALTSGTPVIFEVDGGCGIPETARALALNVTVFNPTGQGNLSLSPGDAAPSGTSSINFLPGMNKANNAIVRLSLDGSQSIGVRPLVAGGGTVHLILDVVGWFE